jgi:serine/threonine-protein kinase
VDDLRKQLAKLKAEFDAGRWKESAKHAPSLVEQARSLEYRPLVAETLLLQGTINYRLNNTPDGEKALTESYLVAETSRHDEVRAEAATGLVWVVGYLDGRADEARRWASLADSILHRLGGHDLLQAWLLNDLGAVLGLKGDMRAMLQYQEQALALKEKVLGPIHPDVGSSEANIAFALQELRQSREALTHIDRSLSILQRGLGAGHPELAMSFSNRGEILNSLGRHREARESFERARAIWERELGNDDRTLAYSLTGIGVSYLLERKPTEALVPLERAFKIREAHEKDALRRAETQFALARSLWESNRDRNRARTLAEGARQGYSATGDKTRLLEVETWLRGRGPT